MDIYSRKDCAAYDCHRIAKVAFLLQRCYIWTARDEACVFYLKLLSGPALSRCSCIGPPHLWGPCAIVFG